MDGVSDAGLRMQQIAAQLAALRAGNNPVARAATSPTTTGAASGPASGATSSAASTSASGTLGGLGTDTTGSSVRGGSSGTISGTASTTSMSFKAVLADALAGRTGTAATTAAASRASAAAAAPVVAAPVVAAPVVAAPGGAAPAAAAQAAGRATGALSASGVPSDLSHYSNGRIPSALLKSIGTGNDKLWAPAADNFRAMTAAAARDGVRLGVNDSYRSYAEQVDLARRKGLYSQGGLAAKPGTSDHGWGKSVDLSLDSRALSWMRSHADEYGFTNNVPRESWHWTYKPK